MRTRPQQDDSKGLLFRRLVDVEARADDHARHVALADRFMAQPEASGVFRPLHTFLRDQLRAALAVPIAVAAEDLAVQGPVLEAIDREIDGLADDPRTQRDFLLSLLAAIGVGALSTAAAFRSGVVRYAAACAENLVWDESSQLPRDLPGHERWFQRPSKSLDLLLLPEEQRDVLRAAYYELRSTHEDVIAALRELVDRLHGQPLGTVLDAGLRGPLDQVVRYIVSSASELWGPTFASFGPPALPDWASKDVENTRRALVLPHDAAADVLYTRFIWSSDPRPIPTYALLAAPRPEESNAPVPVRVPVPTVLDDATRVPRRLTRAYAKNTYESLLQQFRAVEQSAASRGRRIAGPRRRRGSGADEVKLIATRLDHRAAGLGPTQIARLEETDTRHRPLARTVRQSIADAAQELGIEDLPPVPSPSRRKTQRGSR